MAFEDLGPDYFFVQPSESPDAPSELLLAWHRKVIELRDGTLVFTHPPMIGESLHDIRQAKAVIKEFFGVDEQGNTKAKVEYVNCKPSEPLEEEKYPPDAIFLKHLRT